MATKKKATTKTGPKARTWQQGVRAETREETSGRFSKLNPCELCGKSAGADYYSDDRCNEHGHGMVLCKRDATKCAEMSDEQYLAAFAAVAEKTS